MSEPLLFQLYVKPRCPWCVSAKAYLDQNGYPYQEINVLADPKDYDEMIRLSGQSYTPTLVTALVTGNLVLADFGVEELELFLKTHQLTPPLPRSGSGNSGSSAGSCSGSSAGS